MIENSIREQRWQKGLNYARQFIAREGHLRLPDGHEEDGFKLANWISWQRRNYMSGILSEERRRALEALDGWVWAPKDAAWQERLRYAKRFFAREGHARVPAEHVEDGFELGSWVTWQRKFRKRDTLPADRREALEALEGWVWDAHEAAWQKGLDHAKRFVEREGQARVPVRHVEDGFRLGQWVNSRRADYKRDELSPERREALDALDGWVWTRRAPAP